MIRVALNPKSGNAKTGPIAVSRSDRDSCPSACPHRGNGCYAEGFRVLDHWKRVTEPVAIGGRTLAPNGVHWGAFLRQLRALPAGTAFRHNEAGDLPGDTATNRLARKLCIALAEAASHLRAWTYTHFPLRGNVTTLRGMLRRGFAVNVSCESRTQVDQAMEAGVPAVCVLPSDAPLVTLTPAGRRIVVCPEQSGRVRNCAECMLCQRTDRRFAIGFRAHGQRARDVTATVSKT